eukprot:9485431-Pyramimonas_sp.AAC.1
MTTDSGRRSVEGSSHVRSHPPPYPTPRRPRPRSTNLGACSGGHGIRKVRSGAAIDRNDFPSTDAPWSSDRCERCAEMGGARALSGVVMPAGGQPACSRTSCLRYSHRPSATTCTERTVGGWRTGWRGEHGGIALHELE